MKSTFCGCKRWSCHKCHKSLRQQWAIRSTKQFLTEPHWEVFVAKTELQFEAMSKRLRKHNLRYFRIRIADTSYVFHSPLPATRKHRQDPSKWLSSQEVTAEFQKIIDLHGVCRVSSDESAVPKRSVDVPEGYKCGVYKISQLSTGMVYIGKTETSFNARWRIHLSRLDLGLSNNRKLQQAWTESSGDGFVFEIVEVCEKSRCLERERFWIRKFDAVRNGFNSQRGNDRNSAKNMNKFPTNEISGSTG